VTVNFLYWSTAGELLVDDSVAMLVRGIVSGYIITSD